MDNYAVGALRAQSHRWSELLIVCHVHSRYGITA